MNMIQRMLERYLDTAVESYKQAKTDIEKGCYDEERFKSEMSSLIKKRFSR